MTAGVCQEGCEGPAGGRVNQAHRVVADGGGQASTSTPDGNGSALSEADSPSSAQFPATYAYDAKSRVTSMTPGTGPAATARSSPGTGSAPS